MHLGSLPLPGHSLQQALQASTADSCLAEQETLQALPASLQACNAIVAAVAATGSGGLDSHLQAVLLSLSRMGKVLQALDASLASVGALPCTDEFWCSGVLPLVDALLYSERHVRVCPSPLLS
jgi:hypothetical protein